MPLAAHRWVTPRTVPWYEASDGGPVHTVVLVLHGLQQRAHDLAAPLAHLGRDGLALVFPEGLSRALPRPGAPRAGASWSTGDDAEMDLADNLLYLDAFADSLTPRWPEARKILVGFSQGGLMAARWVARRPLPWTRVVLWAASVPRDVDLAAFRTNLGAAELVLALGDVDPMVDPAAVDALLDRLARAGLGWRHLSFEGGHELPPDQLMRALA